MPVTAAVLSEDLIRAAAASAPITASSRTDDIPASWDERAVLTTMLDYARDTVHVKCAGLSDEQARRAPLNRRRRCLGPPVPRDCGADQPVLQ